jgi:hypothetical protein
MMMVSFTTGLRWSRKLKPNSRTGSLSSIRRPPRLEQEFRYDIQWQTHNSGVTTDNYGVSKGLEIIPAKNFEAILAVPPYIVNNPDSPNNGFGDWQFLVYLATAD